jgi:hypothetical protein
MEWGAEHERRGLCDLKVANVEWCEKVSGN